MLPEVCHINGITLPDLHYVNESHYIKGITLLEICKKIH